MARQARQREAQKYLTTPALVSAPTWRAFQLGFILLNLRGLHDPLHAERELVDLLFFPTGGGKTEAYLGLAAFSLVLRRLRNPGRRGAGVNVLMRYTLRLLTLDQLGRASALICALELERQERNARGDARLGDWPFEIGLWVGSAATPNRMGGPGDKGAGADKTAYRRLRAFRSNSRQNPSPIPLENCPWCGTKFETQSFRLLPSEANPQDLRITCANALCAFTGIVRCPSSRWMNRSTGDCRAFSSPPWTSSPRCRGLENQESCSARWSGSTRRASIVPPSRGLDNRWAGRCSRRS